MSAVQRLSPDLALRNPSTALQNVEAALWGPRMAALLFGAFGVLGLLLAVIGVYGVMAYMVLERTNEIGVRMALGAGWKAVMRMIVGQALGLAVVGIAAGGVAALALNRLI